MLASNKISFREFWHHYHAEVWFAAVLAVLIFASTLLSRFIPEHTFDWVIIPMHNVFMVAICLFGSVMMFRHSEGLRIRKLWGAALLAWGLGDLSYLVCRLGVPMTVMDMSAEHLTILELFLGNLLGWAMTLYPTETLRPGWLNWKVVLWQLLPLAALVALDYVVPIDLWSVVVLYPYVLLITVLTHIRAYRLWCEQNYSTMDNIDVQWVIRYCIMLFFVGANYVYICSSHDHTRSFTQLWFVVFMLVYSTEQILFRKDPWRDVQKDNVLSAKEEEIPDTKNSDRMKFEQWMAHDKPYLKPDFQLMDLRAVLPMNRTYLSQFINNTYGCTFFQLVNRYRIEEAKRLMQENPDMKMTEVSDNSGFSSSVVFSHVFSRETGVTPKEWSKGVRPS